MTATPEHRPGCLDAELGSDEPLSAESDGWESPRLRGQICPLHQSQIFVLIPPSSPPSRRSPPSPPPGESQRRPWIRPTGALLESAASLPAWPASCGERETARQEHSAVSGRKLGPGRGTLPAERPGRWRGVAARRGSRLGRNPGGLRQRARAPQGSWTSARGLRGLRDPAPAPTPSPPARP